MGNNNETAMNFMSDIYLQDELNKLDCICDPLIDDTGYENIDEDLECDCYAVCS